MMQFKIVTDGHPARTSVWVVLADGTEVEVTSSTSVIRKVGMANLVEVTLIGSSNVPAEAEWKIEARSGPYEAIEPVTA